jgi:Proteasome subunit
VTVVVGVLCEGGVVIGTDSSATLGTAYAHTIEQPTRKIDIIDDLVIVAGTGEAGLGQRFVEIVRGMRNENKLKGSYIAIGEELARRAWNNFNSTGAAGRRQAGSESYPVVGFGALVAFWTGDKAHLVELAEGSLQPEFKSEEAIWYVSMGSGQPIADPFLGMMRETFCKEGCPQMALATFITCWALSHTIDLNTGGINGPLTIALLSKEGDKPVARMLTADEVDDHIQAVKGAYQYLAGYPETFEQTTANVPT